MRIVSRLATVLVFVFLAACATVPQVVPPTGDPGIDAWNALRAGNRAFLTGTITFTGLAQRMETQNPPVTILSCSDSRVPPELVFRQTVGRVFIVRAAGNVADPFGIASIEYAIDHGYTKLLVILAHEKCGAVESAIKAGPDPRGPTPSLEALLKKIRESFRPPECTLADPACWGNRTYENAIYTIDDLKRRSEVIAKAVDGDPEQPNKPKLPVVIAYYDLYGNVRVWKSINIAVAADTR
jgi:carbonic anhydrase